MQDNLKNEKNELYFTDRQYHKGRYKSRPKPYGKRSSCCTLSQVLFHCSKKYFICGKEGCWLSNHTQQEQDDSKKYFIDKYPEYKTRLGYDYYLQQYIIYCKGENIDVIDTINDIV